MHSKKKPELDEPDNSPERGSGADRLEYVADLVGELQAIAGELGCETLAGLLRLSQLEARIQAGASRK